MTNSTTSIESIDLQINDKNKNVACLKNSSLKLKKSSTYQRF